jgi:hypothetical protein
MSCVHACINTCIRISICIYMWAQHTRRNMVAFYNIYVSVHACKNLCVHLLIHTHTHTHTHSYKYIQLSSHLCTCIYIYIYIYIYTHMRTWQGAKGRLAPEKSRDLVKPIPVQVCAPIYNTYMCSCTRPCPSINIKLKTNSARMA